MRIALLLACALQQHEQARLKRNFDDLNDGDDDDDDTNAPSTDDATAALNDGHDDGLADDADGDIGNDGSGDEATPAPAGTNDGLNMDPSPPPAPGGGGNGVGLLEKYNTDGQEDVGNYDDSDGSMDADSSGGDAESDEEFEPTAGNPDAETGDGSAAEEEPDPTVAPGAMSDGDVPNPLVDSLIEVPRKKKAFVAPHARSNKAFDKKFANAEKRIHAELAAMAPKASSLLETGSKDAAGAAKGIVDSSESASDLWKELTLKANKESWGDLRANVAKTKNAAIELSEEIPSAAALARPRFGLASVAPSSFAQLSPVGEKHELERELKETRDADAAAAKGDDKEAAGFAHLRELEGQFKDMEDNDRAETDREKNQMEADLHAKRPTSFAQLTDATREEEQQSLLLRQKLESRVHADQQAADLSINSFTTQTLSELDALKARLPGETIADALAKAHATSSLLETRAKSRGNTDDLMGQLEKLQAISQANIDKQLRLGH